MKITIEKTALGNSCSNYGQEPEKNKGTKIIIGLERLPSIDTKKWVELKEAIDKVADLVGDIDV